MTFFRNFFNISKGFPFNFSIFCNKLDVKKAQRVPLLHFRYYETNSKFSFSSEIRIFQYISTNIFFNAIRIFALYLIILRFTESEQNEAEVLENKRTHSSDHETFGYFDTFVSFSFKKTGAYLRNFAFFEP